jgi:hypothetical protein
VNEEAAVWTLAGQPGSRSDQGRRPEGGRQDFTYGRLRSWGYHSSLPALPDHSQTLTRELAV